MTCIIAGQRYLKCFEATSLRASTYGMAGSCFSKVRLESHERVREQLGHVFWPEIR